MGDYADRIVAENIKKPSKIEEISKEGYKDFKRVKRMVYAGAGLVVLSVLGFFISNVDYSIKLRKEGIIKYADTNRDGFISDAEKREFYEKVSKLIEDYNNSKNSK